MSVFSSSRLVQALEALVSRLEAAAASSNVRRVVGHTWEAVSAGDRARVIAFSSIVITVAMALHIVLVVFVQPYAYPSRAELVLPACLLVVGLAALLMRNGVAAAWPNRRTR